MATVSTRDGIQINYSIHGDDRPAARRLVLVHSLGMNGTVWEWVIDRLAPHTTVLTFDCRGHGASTRAPGPYQLETFAGDLADLLDHVGWDRCFLAGGSMGGNVSLQFAILYPSRVSGLGLIDTTAWYGPEAHERWEQRAREAEERGLAPLIDFQESRWFTDSFRAARPEGVTRCRSVFLANDPACFAATCRMLGSFDLRAGLPALRMPTVVLVGEQDYATPPAMARDIQSGIPDATLQVIPGARHLTFVEHPGVVADALTGLLNRAH
jgi:3-oxoadipate enol-lactonase